MLTLWKAVTYVNAFLDLLRAVAYERVVAPYKDSTRRVTVVELDTAHRHTVHNTRLIAIYLDYLLSCVLGRRHTIYKPLSADVDIASLPVHHSRCSTAAVVLERWDGTRQLWVYRKCRHVGFERSGERWTLGGVIDARICSPRISINATDTVCAFLPAVSALSPRELVVLMYGLGYIRQSTAIAVLSSSCIHASLVLDHTLQEVVVKDGALLLSAA
ncbi:hypothetical protein HYH03_003665 [Edaphochlamys debaryana]|uniref:Uncharacterized protein n=1 Tax=Edaphochlamys debaryana TaxID=47281 RepID=A0A835Y9C4_9CHLO|nr:hypothetical protein HYH03_003665 [Edaphochlamys debaryana]|eukprot:KAG2498406.1 hypothetical protein HYH03_003665 [Edaphochlamys debaryana]